MINKSITIALKNITSSNKGQKVDTFINYASAFFKTPISSHPLEIQVEPSAVCNLKCKMCSLDKSSNKIKFLTPKNLSIIINKFKPNSINLTGMGETLLNPFFEQLLKLCFEQKIKSSFITNIQLLNSKHLQAIKKYPPTNISISMESGYSHKYNQIRSGANLHITIQKIQELLKFIKENSLPTQVNINVVFLDFNLKDLKHIYKIIDIASLIGIKKITSQNINKLSPYIRGLYVSHRIERKFSHIKNYSEKSNIEIILPSTKLSTGKCYYPWVYPQITATGEILPCCVIPQFGTYDYIVKKFSFGNIITDSLSKSWNSKLAQNFRKRHRSSSPCRYCTKNCGVL